MTADAHKALRDYLMAQLPSFSVYAGVTYPAPGYKPADGPAIAMKVRGGQEEEQDQLLKPSFQFKVYGTSAINAWSNYLNLDQALKPPTDTVVLWAIQEGMGTPLVEPESGWDFVLAFYQVMVRNT